MRQLAKIEILKGGAYSTVQDGGRRTYRKEGIPQSGPMDERSAKLANWLVGNAPDAANIEMTMSGVSLTADIDLCYGITGAEASVMVDERAVACNQTNKLMAGEKLKIGIFSAGIRAYLAIAGELKEASQLTSHATYVRASLGANEGKALQSGDQIMWHSPENSMVSVRTLSEQWLPKWNQEIIRICRGPEWGLMNEVNRELFFKNLYLVSKDSDRMGIRLEAPQPLEISNTIISSPVDIGVIQITGGGQPIVLMNDAQTVGGYPRIGFIAKTDLRVLAQKRPGDPIRFKLISHEENLHLIARESQKMKLFLSQEE